ncbi:MAG: PepSY-associated TM helix domain-containing protein [Bacteroidota bacterium]
MKKKFKKYIGQLHLWLGLACGTIIFLLGITGCILAFEVELKELLHQDKLFVEPESDSQPLLLSRSLELANQSLGEDIKVQRLYVPSDPQRSIIAVNYTPDSNPTGIWYWDSMEHYLHVYVNPYKAKVLDKEDETFEFFYFVEWLHYSLLLKTEIGQPIIGYATLIFVFLLFSGLILWWPNNKKAFKARSWFQWKSTTKWKRKNYDLHNIVGFYAMFLVIFIALTGLMWAFTWFNDGVVWLANGGYTMEKETVKVESTYSFPGTIRPLDVAHQYLKTNYPKANTYHVRLPEDTFSTIGIYVDYTNNTRDVYLQFDQYSGQLLHTGGQWEYKTNGEKISALNYDIHVGAIGGMVGKTIAFFLSLFAASLPVTGFLIWYGRTFKKVTQRTNQLKGPVVLHESS